MAVNTYDGLTASIQTWSERDYGADQLQDFVALAEADFNLVVVDYRRERTGTITTDANGEATLPDGFRMFRAVSHVTYGPMSAKSWDAISVLNPLSQGGIPYAYAASGTTFKVVDVFQGDFAATWVEDLPPLTADNQTNWLIETAPQAYLWMCLAQERAFREQFDAASGMEAKAMAVLAKAGVMSNLAQFSRASHTIRGVTP